MLDVDDLIVAGASDLDRPLLAAGFERATAGEGPWTFECPMCSKRFRHDELVELVCTGPSESRDEHEPTLMNMLEG